MTARSFLEILTSKKSGWVDPGRDHVLTGKERHVPCQADGPGGYPMRAIRTRDFLYIRNFKPERWPAGAPEAYRDIDGSPTKTYMMDHRDDPEVAHLFELAFGKRSSEELYDLKKDPDQLHNVAQDSRYAGAKLKLARALTEELVATGDPRILGQGDVFETYPYYGNMPKKKSGRNPLVLPSDPVQFQVKQRGYKSIPGSDGKITVSLGDITAGQVFLKVHYYQTLVDKSVKQNEIVEVEVEGQTFYLYVAQLVNFLVGDDYCVIEISSTKPKPKPVEFTAPYDTGQISETAETKDGPK